ncbi:PTS mannitol transporter subunit IICB [Streptococcus mutans]|jgi:PTS system mannitol-specific IIC component|uniref:PTS system mannitol-specific EIICB component n=1 Tax=Streptococcus mutans serotype c (strain ATCC 700610 / UA159) TaxID=210007 RepID=PTMCB_STRMU|nr:PTS mannitol transporter subunit IICB [Streptococcus mutans]Q9KJ75.2 RecName: Full=PTS system mannitol-specific EIICB component; AltName: Full=EIICB-Mtl; Short=EII-Mtl; Includes: RecName: Full=Mannitol permease IIC component; AltName: Full=PTS system mannitol-specific EIIC component; Includes: RecName: Full=Mannitol-specific phosphotransferase enzyme IIB component; AltName: Full=PTS system mannitol-specific EIIB component [Streptococcus mutans UA159]EMB59964.1 PTS system, mannitol-specific enz
MERKSSLKVRVQKLGTSLSNMVMPNIGAFIAWGVAASLFIATGYLPNKALDTNVVGPMLKYVLPLLIGYTGGYNIHKQRGGVIGAIASFGAIAGSTVTMFIGAMIMGPLSAWILKKFDEKVQPKIRTGFEMLVNNFSLGLIGFALMVLAFFVIGPVVAQLTEWVGIGVEAIVKVHLLPLANLIIEPAKILFLNNALNHGIFTPLGTEQVAKVGKSVLFLLEANPGPGLGVLIAYAMFGKGSAKSSSWGAMIIHFFGGIHEIYFPYVMMKPAMFLAVIAGGLTGTFTFQTLGAGLTAPASPGSIIAIMGMSPKGWGPHLVVLAGVFAAAVASFLVASIILKSDNSDDDSLETAQAVTQAAKAESKGQAVTEPNLHSDITTDNIHQIIFACDAGMGSSAMGASILRDKVKKAGLDISVSNQAISNLQDTANTLIVTQEELADRAGQKTPRAVHVAVDNFLATSKYDDIIASLTNGKASGSENAAHSTQADSAEIDLNQIDAVVFAYGIAKGSATMGQETLRSIFKQNNVKIPVSTASYAHLSDYNAKNILLVTTIAQQGQAQQAAPNAQILVVDSLVTTPEYDKLVARMHK